MPDDDLARGALATPDARPAAATTEQIEWLVEEFGPTLYRVAMSIVRDRQAAEDIVQEVLVKAWSSMPSWDGDVPIRWARTVTRNAALSHLRTRTARPAVPTERFDSIAPVTAGVDESFERNETTDRMWTALARLGAEERTMLVMHEVDGLAYQEIAATFGLSVSAVRSKLYRARVTLRSEVLR